MMKYGRPMRVIRRGVRHWCVCVSQRSMRICDRRVSHCVGRMRNHRGSCVSHGHRSVSHRHRRRSHSHCRRFLVDHRVEAVDGVGGVLDGPLGAVGLQEAVAALDDVAVARFVLVLDVTGYGVLEGSRELKCVEEAKRFINDKNRAYGDSLLLSTN